MGVTSIRVVALVLAVLSVACGHSEAPTPEATVTAFVSAMESARSDPAQRQRAYELLSERARRSLAERAQRASEVSGWELHPWEMLAPGRWQPRIEFDPEGLSVRVMGDRAVVTARGRGGGAAEVPLVREGRVWKLDLVLPAMESIHPGDSPQVRSNHGA